MNRRLAPLVEAASVLLSLAVIAGYARLFDSGSWVRPMVIMALASHGISIAARRLRLGLFLSTLLSFAGLIFTGTLVFYRGSSTFGIPNGATRAALRADLDTGWESFQNVTAPTEATTGLIIAAALGVWLTAYLIDWAAFRLHSSIEALIPPLAVFILQTVLGAEVHQVSSAVFFAAAALLFFLAHRTDRFELDGNWLGDNARPGGWALLRTGGALTAVVVLAAALFGPQVPGADADALVDIDPGGGGGGTRIAINPLVEIQSQLVDLPDTIAFTGTSDVADYWKLASLDNFNGSEWTLGSNFDEAGTELPSGEPGGLPTDEVIQTVAVDNLGGDWLPAAYQPRSFQSNTIDAEWDPTTGSLLIKNGTELERGDFYTVVSELPNRTAAQVEDAVERPIPPDILETNTALPDGFSNVVRDEARRIVEAANAQGQYEQALALQNHLRSDVFTYDIDVVKGHSNDRIEDFLLDSRTGYCEQFAGSFAAMARTLRIPTRVAVGFTPGEQIPGTLQYVVRGRHAHAWPEVWFADVGWVRFEPTPNRGAPRDSAITQQEPQPPETITPNSAPETIPTPETQPVQPRPSLVPDQPDDAQPVGGVAEDQGFSFGPWLGRFAFLVLLLGTVAGAAWMLRTAKARKRQRFRGRPDATRDSVKYAWADALEHAHRMGITQQSAETPHELANRSGNALGEHSEPFRELAGLRTAAHYSPTDPSVEAAERAAIIADGIRETTISRMTNLERVRYELDPRPLLVRDAPDTQPPADRQAVTVD
ncbi:MAG: hypothetical protein HKN26_01540 [Acidimicrobiales bacterium]|nr:hypothetical protein [Acidimicrobiales bacterium]